ncbi:MAG: hypothetical protein LBS12_00185 [Prevotellaceae bacterium]|nr:hypothetical protein [Prevotellaceae bacterium]
MKKSTFKNMMTVLTAMVAVLFFSCNTEDVNPDTPYIASTGTVVTIPVEGGDWAIPITSNRPWTVSVEPAIEWLVVDTRTGANNGEITFSVGPNSGTTREATLHVATSSVFLDIRIVQTGAIATTVLYAEDCGTTGTTASPHVTVTAYTGWNTSGTGADNVTYSMDGGSVTVRGNAVSSGYDGASGASNVMMAAGGASFLINNINPTGVTVMSLSFGANETSDIMKLYYNTGDANWTEVPYEKTTTEWGLVTVGFEIPAGSTVLNLKYTAGVTTYGTRVDDIKLVGNGGGPVGDLSISPSSLSFAAAGETKTFTVTSAKAWTVTSSDPSWCTVSPASGSGDATINVTATANTGAQRPATITVKTTDNSTTKTLSVTQAGAGGGTAIYYESMGAVAVSGSTVTVALHEGWLKEGSGAGGVTYAGTNTTIRTSVASAGYDGASGGNEVFFGAAPANFTVSGIALSNVETVTLTFGASKVYYDSGNKWDPFAAGDLTLSYSANGSQWTAVNWTLASEPERGASVTWALASVVIPTTGTSSLHLKWDCTFPSQIRIDDLKVVAGGTVVTTPNPTVSTADASAVEETTATLGGSYIPGSDAITETGVEYKTGSDAYTVRPASGTATPFTVSVTGLTGVTAYTFRAYAKTANGTFYGAEKVFQTKTPASAYIWQTNVGATPVSGTTQIAAFSGWETVGTGAANVTYDGSNATIRSSSTSSGYEGASGGNNVFFGTPLPAYFTVGNINVAGLTSATLTFGSTGNNYDAASFTVSYSYDGAAWVPVSYTRATGAAWALATATIPISGTTLHLKWQAYTASTYRIDDMSLVSSGTVTPPANPSVTTAAASAIDKTTATVGGSYVAGSDAITETGVEYKTGSDAYTARPASGTATPFTVSLTGLTANTAYTFKAYAKAGGTTFYGSEKTFTTLSDYTLVVAPPTLSFAAAGETKTFTVTSNTGWTVTSSDPSWCTASPASGSNDATINVTATANTGAQRSATITISGTGVSNQTVAVTQAAGASGGGTLAEWNFGTLYSSSVTVTSMLSSDGSSSSLTTTASSTTPGSFEARTHTSASSYYVVATTWGTDKTWGLEIPVTSAANGSVKLSFYAQSSGTGPRDFAVEWSADGSNWSVATDTEKYTLNTSSSAKAITVTTSGLTTKLYLRLRVTSNTSVNDGTIATGGTSRITGKLTVERL